MELRTCAHRRSSTMDRAELIKGVLEMEIPELTDEERARRVRIKPLVKRRGKIYEVPEHDIEGVSFPWLDLTNEFAGELHEIAKIRTLHSWAYYGFFKPSVLEVLAQIPEELVDRIDFFTVDGPETAADLIREKEAMDAGFHVAETTLYGSKINGL